MPWKTFATSVASPLGESGARPRGSPPTPPQPTRAGCASPPSPSATAQRASRRRARPPTTPTARAHSPSAGPHRGTYTQFAASRRATPARRTARAGARAAARSPARAPRSTSPACCRSGSGRATGPHPRARPPRAGFPGGPQAGDPRAPENLEYLLAHERWWGRSCGLALWSALPRSRLTPSSGRRPRTCRLSRSRRSRSRTCGRCAHGWQSDSALSSPKSWSPGRPVISPGTRVNALAARRSQA
jgi:hypothetical protein